MTGIMCLWPVECRFPYLFSWRTIRDGFQRPPDFHQNPNLFNRDPQIFVRDPNLFIGDLNLLIWNPRFSFNSSLTSQTFSFWTPNFQGKPKDFQLRLQIFRFKPTIFIGDLRGLQCKSVKIWGFNETLTLMNILGFLH